MMFRTSKRTIPDISFFFLTLLIIFSLDSIRFVHYIISYDDSMQVKSS